MAKKKEVTNTVKLQIPAGKANPAPPVGPALGQAGLNIQEFCQAFNDRTKGQEGPIPVVISVYKDRSFDFVTKLPPMSYLIMKELKLKKGSSLTGSEFIGKMSVAQAKKVAEVKMQDLNAFDLDAATNMVLGTAKSMGLDTEEPAAANDAAPIDESEAANG